jgi:hypothetical protein
MRQAGHKATLSSEFQISNANQVSWSSHCKVVWSNAEFEVEWLVPSGQLLVTIVDDDLNGF